MKLLLFSNHERAVFVSERAWSGRFTSGILATT